MAVVWKSIGIGIGGERGGGERRRRTTVSDLDLGWWRIGGPTDKLAVVAIDERGSC